MIIDDEEVEIRNSFFLETKDGARIELYILEPSEYQEFYSVQIDQHVYRESSDYYNEISVIHFQEITTVKYFYKLGIIAMISKQKDYFSDLWLYKSGAVRISVAEPISFYNKQDLWTYDMANREGEEVFSLE